MQEDVEVDRYLPGRKVGTPYGVPYGRLEYTK
jgi:hypothetical protein